MGRSRQKIKVGKYEVVILNMEAKGWVVVKVLDKKGKSLGQLRIEGDGGWFETDKIDLPINLNKPFTEGPLRYPPYMGRPPLRIIKRRWGEKNPGLKFR